MNLRAFSPWLVGAVCACAGAPDASRSGGDAAIPPTYRAVEIVFEPPLAERGSLLVAHESGYVWRGEVGRAGCVVHLPEGPCSLRLECAGRVTERVCKVAAEPAPIVWRLR